jgi:hypothetical protein
MTIKLTATRGQSLKYPHFLGRDNGVRGSLRQALIDRAKRAHKKAVVQYRASQCLDHLTIFRQEWVTAKEDLRDVDIGISNLKMLPHRSHDHQTRIRGPVSTHYRCKFSPVHANGSVSSHSRPKSVLETSVTANSYNPAVDSAKKQTRKSGVHECLIFSLSINSFCGCQDLGSGSNIAYTTPLPTIGHRFRRHYDSRLRY